MKRITVIAIVVLSLWWLNEYIIPRSGPRSIPLSPIQRYNYSVTRDKPALPFILETNEAIRAGDMPEDVCVYGFWLEDHRGYANFRWIGSIYGYADHYSFAAQCGRVRVQGESGNTYTIHPAHRLWIWLSYYDVDYLVWDDLGPLRAVNYFKIKIPVDSRDWECYFIQHKRLDGLHVWELRPEPVYYIRVPMERMPKVESQPVS